MKSRVYAVLMISLISALATASLATAQNSERIVRVTSAEDAGEGSLRAALLDAQSGDQIIFDPQVFPVENPTRILLESQLPDLQVGRITIDGTGSGVILDGSLLGGIHESGFIDDVQLLNEAGKNLLVNGDFQSDLNHWLIWQNEDLGIARWTAEAGLESEGAVELAPNPRSGAIMLAYHNRNIAENLHGAGNEPSGRTAPLPIANARHLTLVFQYKQLNLSVNIEINNEDGSGSYDSDSQGFNYSTSWAQGVFDLEVPDGATELFLTFDAAPSEFVSGLVIISNDNVIQGLQIENFPGDAIQILGGSRNQIGGARPNLNVPCLSPCNVLSGNIGSGVYLDGGGENVIQGNFVGVDFQGISAQANGMNGVRMFYTTNNLVGGQGGEGNIIGVNSMNIEINEGASYNRIIGNYIGVDISGKLPLGSPHAGISVTASNNTLANNVISANEVGITLIGEDCYANQISNNAIGTDSTHTLDLGNESGIQFLNGAHNNQIGPGNYILFNQDSGVYVAGSDTLGNRITQNIIMNNGNGGIILSSEAYDANRWVAPPAEFTATAHKIAGYAAPNTELELYTSNDAQSGRYLATVLTDDEGKFSYIPSPRQTLDDYITILAFDADGTTSEFSNATAPVQTFVQALPGAIGPQQVSKAPKVIAVNVGLAFAALLVLGTATTYFNETLENYSEEIDRKFLKPFKRIVAWVIHWLTRLFRVKKKQASKVKEHPLLRKVIQFFRNVWVSWVLIVMIASAIQSFLNVDANWTLDQLGAWLTLFGGGLIVSGLQTFSEYRMRKKYQVQLNPPKQAEVGWPGTVLAAVSTGISMLLNLSPGIVLGSVDTFFLQPNIEDDLLDAQRAFSVKSTILLVTFGLWLLSPLAAIVSPGLEEFLIMLFYVGLTYAFFELIPLDVLDGSVLYKQSFVAWLTLTGLSFFGMFHLMFNPEFGDLQDILNGDVRVVFWVLVAAWVLALLLRWSVAEKNLLGAE